MGDGVAGAGLGLAENSGIVRQSLVLWIVSPCFTKARTTSLFSATHCCIIFVACTDLRSAISAGSGVEPEKAASRVNRTSSNMGKFTFYING